MVETHRPFVCNAAAHVAHFYMIVTVEGETCAGAMGASPWAHALEGSPGTFPLKFGGEQNCPCRRKCGGRKLRRQEDFTCESLKNDEIWKSNLQEILYEKDSLYIFYYAR